MPKNFLQYFMLVIVFIGLSFAYINTLETQSKKLQNIKYQNINKNMKYRLHNMIILKQKATLAMAISLANDENLFLAVTSKKVDKNYYKKLIYSFNKNTQYKNIWIHILDKDLNSLYRSWSNLTYKDASEIRPDLEAVLETKEVANIYSPDLFGFTLKAIVPLMQGKKFLGIIEIISHFNSISSEFNKLGISSIVVLKKEFSKKVKKPFTNIFIDDYYIANLDANSIYLNYLKERGIENYFHNSYWVDKDYVISSYELKGLKNEVVGYYIMFKNKDTLSNLDLDFLVFKWVTYGIFIIVLILIFWIIMLFHKSTKEKRYYKNILDSSTNMVVINDKQYILSVNKVFFKYFSNYKTLESFKTRHKCVCDFFLKEDGYIQKDMGGMIWVDYLLLHPDLDNKVKIKYYDDEYYFLISASLVSKEKSHYSIVFTDITQAEKYKHELEYLTVTDTLTGVKNRRYFNQRLTEEMVKAKRYGHPLSLIMCDIDFFKKVNDTHGHDVGDEVLIEYSKYILSLIRDVDVFCRVGGEEFMIILPYANKSNAMLLAEKLRVKVSSYGKILPITMSFGVTQYVIGEESGFLYKRVDDALYEAKEKGRNRVVVV